MIDIETEFTKMRGSMINEDSRIVQAKIKELKSKYQSKFLLVVKQEGWEEDKFNYAIGEKKHIEEMYNKIEPPYGTYCWMEEIK